MVKQKIKNYRTNFLLRKKYCTGDRTPFYKIVEKYLPADKNTIIVDVGSGDGMFAEVLNLSQRYTHFFLLEANPQSLEYLKNKFGSKRIIEYKIPKRIPFSDNSVNLIHCSHIIEHLKPEELYKFFMEMDRVLMPEGFLVVSSPLLWSRFYDDLSHIKPYNPSVFIKYFTANSNQTKTRGSVSNKYKVIECIYRYRTEKINDTSFYGSKFFLIDLFFYFFKILINKLGFRKYLKNGYTIILQKYNRSRD